ncbi:MAG: ABC transporter substrate-binding protein [Nocardioides sp.]|uniref:ABC transporter substrate-binding protein n=1 Tax=Nocardioides sp. TaxID=35761 RepID=UPI0039E56A4A
MAKPVKRLMAVGAVGALALGLVACGGGSDNSSGGSSSSGSGSTGTKGGELIISQQDPVDHWDPQRTYTGVDLSNETRLFYRQLVAYPASSDTTEATTPVPDLATDTGTSSKGGRQWQFTLKKGVKWQDGSAITCADFQYGASRVFATDTITGGPNYLLNYLDVPRKSDGTPVYDGPYKGDGQAGFDKAITCSNNNRTITYKFNKPWPDFPLAVASLHMMDPYKKSEDKGAKNDDVVFSDGPYEVGPNGYDPDKGGTFVRNPNYDASTDNPDLRQALPDEITFKFGDTPETIYEELFADSGDAQRMISENRIPTSDFARISSAQDRYLQVESPYVDYVVLNFKRLTNPLVRKALAASTNRESWIAAGGGAKAYKAATSIVNPSVKGYQSNPAFSGSNSGDVAKAKQLLKQAGVSTPYPITFTYPQSDTVDKQAAALADTWDKAGFKVTLDPLGDVYYSKIQKPSNTADVIWGGWGADWPSAITVTPPLFDSTVNFSADSNGQDYGNYQSAAFNKLAEKARSATTLTQQTKYLQKADLQLGKDTAYIPLEISIFNWLHGSKVTGFTTTAASSSFPDLGPIGVED